MCCSWQPPHVAKNEDHGGVTLAGPAASTAVVRASTCRFRCRVTTARNFSPGTARVSMTVAPASVLAMPWPP